MTFFALRGDKALIAKLKKLDRKVGNKISRQSLRAGAKVVQGAVKREVAKKKPAGRGGDGRYKRIGPPRTGRLAKAIKVRAGKRKRVNGQPRIGINVQVGEGDFKGETFYGGFVEYDHKTGKRGSANRRTVKGRGNIKKGFEASKAQAIAVSRDHMKRGIAEATK